MHRKRVVLGGIFAVIGLGVIALVIVILTNKFDASHQFISSVIEQSDTIKNKDRLILHMPSGFRRPEELKSGYQPTLDYLSAAIGMTIEMVVVDDFSKTIEGFKTGTVDLTWGGGARYVRLDHPQIIAMELRNDVPGYNGAFIVHKDNDVIHSWLDLKGKRFVFGDRASTLTYNMPVYLLREAGIGLRDLGKYEFVGSHNDVIMTVLYKEADAGMAMASIAEQYTNKGLKIIELSPRVPPCAWVANKNMERSIVKKIRAALLELDLKNSDHAAILNAYGRNITGFAAGRIPDIEFAVTLIETGEREWKNRR